MASPTAGDDALPFVDVFTYNGEAEMLRYRLALHSAFASSFLLLETNTTFTGRPKRRAEMAAAQKAFAKERRALEDKLAAQTSSAEELMHKRLLDQLEEQKEKRVAHLQQMAARRMGQMDLANGFGTWQDQWAEVARQKRMLAAAGARLQRPQLVASLAPPSCRKRHCTGTLWKSGVKSTLAHSLPTRGIIA